MNLVVILFKTIESGTFQFSLDSIFFRMQEVFSCQQNKIYYCVGDEMGFSFVLCFYGTFFSDRHLFTIYSFTE